jgi:hypothetical protein
MQFIEIKTKNGVNVLININFIECVIEDLITQEISIYSIGSDTPFTVNMSLKEFKDKYLLLTI